MHLLLDSIFVKRVWSEALHVVRPQTVIRWHRQGFRAFWTWKSRHGRAGRPSVDSEVAELVRNMALANPLWGSPRIHGELLKLGFELSQRSVARLIPRRPKSPSETCDGIYGGEFRRRAKDAPEPRAVEP